MTISSLLSGASSTLLGSGTTASQANPASSGGSPVLAQAEKRIQANVDATTAQISKFGLLQSALSGAQVAAKAMASLSGTTSPTDATAALGHFFNAFNASVGAANAASTATAAGSESERGKRLVQVLRSALSSDPAIADDMRKLGLKVQSDGTLLQDPKKFAAALAADPSGTLAAMAKVGSKADSVAGIGLSANGDIGSALAKLKAQGTSLTAQQNALKALDKAMAAVSTSSPWGTGISAYQSNMTGF